MTGSSEHLAFEVLSEYVDGRLPAERRAAIERHLDLCSICRTEHDMLRRLLDSAASVPRSILPEHDMWPELREALAARKEAVLQPVSPTPVHADPTEGPAAQRPAAHAPPPRLRSIGARDRAWLAAAAVVLVVASSGVTALMLRHGDSGGADFSDGAPAPAGAPAAVLPVGFRSAEFEYVRTIGELQLALQAQRQRLDPRTVATVERSLTVIDSAITEARAALLADPNNETLADLLSASYQRKLDLLRRASELTSRI